MTAPHKTRDELLSTVAAAQRTYDAAWQIYLTPRARPDGGAGTAASVDHAKAAVTTAHEALETAQRALAAYRPPGMTRLVLRAFDDLERRGYVSPLDPPPGDPRAAHPAHSRLRVVRGGR